MEIWKNIEGYEGMYQVSNEGRVKSLKFGKEKIMKPNKDRNGYLNINLRKDEKRRIFAIHRLVAQAFLPNPNNYEEVNHKDEDKTNNVVSGVNTNLEWCNRQYNCNYGTRTERISKQVNQYTLDDKLIATYSSTHEVERQLGFANQNISACCNGKFNTAYKYKWRYVD